jgi:hypothetical protein
MNVMEFVLVPYLLVFGRFNSLFALLFIGIVYYNEFVLKKGLNVDSYDELFKKPSLCRRNLL